MPHGHRLPGETTVESCRGCLHGKDEQKEVNVLIQELAVADKGCTHSVKVDQCQCGRDT